MQEISCDVSYVPIDYEDLQDELSVSLRILFHCGCRSSALRLQEIFLQLRICCLLNLQCQSKQIICFFYGAYIFANQMNVNNRRGTMFAG